MADRSARAPARRFLALHLPGLATDRIRRAEPDLPHDRPLATWAQAGARRLLVAVDRAAADAGLRPGQALADARAIAPDVLLRLAAPEQDAEALRALALEARRYTPLVAADPPDGLLLDITGCAHLFGGEPPLLRDALAWLHRAGFAARAAVAGAAATAAALARTRSGNPVVATGGEPEAVAPLPLGPALRLPGTMAEKLARLGLRRVGDLLRQPRAPLARRFDPTLIERLDAVTGRRTEPFRSVLPPADLRIVRDLIEPIGTREAIEEALDRLLAALCARLRDAGLGARRIVLSAWRTDGTRQEVAIGTGLPSREPAHLARLFATRLDGLAPGPGFERMALEARMTDPLPAGRQGGLGVDGARGGRDEGTRAAALAQLLDRLAAQGLRVRRVAPLASHWPEHMVRPLPPHAPTPPAPPDWTARWPAVPVLLLRRPEPLAAALTPLPDGPPLRLRWRGAVHQVLRAAGPQRLEPEWWRDRPGPSRRDYYRVELPSGVRLWVYRAEGRWLLHGYLP